MLKTILVPLDGSVIAERALPYAETIARRTGATILLVRAVPLPESLGMVLRAEEMALEAEAYLGAQAGHLAAHGLPSGTRLLYGDAAEAITAEAARAGAAMIVMATHGRTGLGRLLFGSVAEGVTRRAGAPLLLVRGGATEAAPSLAAHPKVIVPLDGSPFAEAALAPAATLTMALGGELVLLHAVAPTEPVAMPKLAGVWPADCEARRGAGRTYLHNLVTRNATSGCQVHFDVRLDTPASAIADAVREHEAALVVMATHGRNALGRLILGGVAQATLTHADVPLLLIRPQTLAGTLAGAAPRVAAP